MTRETFFTLLRWLIGLALLGGAWHFLSTDQDPLDIVRLLIAAVAGLAGIAFLWTTIFDLATRPFLALIDLVYSPGGRLEKPILNLKLPAHYLNEGRHEDALAEYLQILKHYPNETEAYEKAIWLEANIFGNAGEARRLLRRAKRRRLTLDPAVVHLVDLLRHPT